MKKRAIILSLAGMAAAALCCLAAACSRSPIAASGQADTAEPMVISDDDRALLDAGVSWKRAGLSPPDYPLLKRFAYRNAAGNPSVYLVQEPRALGTNAPIVVYLHGARKNETQGMTLFPKLRELLAARRWLYVSPRAYECQALVPHLLSRYGERRVFLAGASLGGKAAYEAAMAQPKRYAGLFLIGPALHSSRPPAPGQIVIPTYLIFGDSDPGNTEGARAVAAALQEQNVRCLSDEIPGGHNAPYRGATWWPRALTFVTGTDFEKPMTNNTARSRGAAQ